jgi:hypothetical protein
MAPIIKKVKKTLNFNPSENRSEALNDEFPTFDNVKGVIEIDNLDCTVKQKRLSTQDNSPCFPEAKEIGIASPKRRAC